MANEPELTIEFMTGAENGGADLLSRSTYGQREKDTSGPSPVVNQISVWDEIWEEHLKGHWGVFKTYHALKKKDSNATSKRYKKSAMLVKYVRNSEINVRKLLIDSRSFPLIRDIQCLRM